MNFPQPSWKPGVIEDACDIADCMKVYTNRSRAFVVYAFGTTVFSDSASLHEDDTFHKTLLAVVRQSPDFKVMPMEDTNLMIRFSGPVCGLVLADFFELHRRDIIAGAASGGLLPGESLLSPQDIAIPEAHYYAGLYGRAKLYRDASNPNIEIRFSP